MEARRDPLGLVAMSSTGAPTTSLPDSLWPANTLASCSAATYAEVQYCYHQHDGICVSNSTECDALDGVFHDGVGCGGPQGSGCSCCKNTFLTVAPTGGPPAPDPTVAPTTGVPENLWPENKLATCDAAVEEHEVQYCFQHHDGVCVSSEAECEALDGTFKDGVGCGGPQGSGCSCCRNAYQTFAPSGAPPVPTAVPTGIVPETIWPQNTLATCDAATFAEVRYCYQRHDGGVCVANATECEALGGRKYKHGVGCGGPRGSACSCCKGPFFTRPPTTVPISSKKSSSDDIPVLYLVLFALLIFFLAYCCGVITIEYKRRREKQRNIAKYRPKTVDGDKEEEFDGSAEAIATRIERLGAKAAHVAEMIRLHQIDCHFLNSLDEQGFEETLDDIGCNERLFKRRVAFEFRAAAACA